MKNPQPSNLLIGMKAITQYLGVSESTVLKWHRELDLPIKKTGRSGYWVGSRERIEVWSKAL